MPEFVGGLPLHPLIVHFVVALLPIAVLGSILTAVWPAVRRRFGWLAVAAAVIGTALVPVATTSGDNLAARVGVSPQVKIHQELADLMFWWALGLTVAVAALMVLHTKVTRPEPAKAAAIGLVVAAVLTVGVAVGTGIHIYRVGDTGARSVWEGVANLPPQNGG